MAESSFNPGYGPQPPLDEGSPHSSQLLTRLIPRHLPAAAGKTVDFLYALQGQGELGCGFLCLFLPRSSAVLPLLARATSTETLQKLLHRSSQWSLPSLFSSHGEKTESLLIRSTLRLAALMPAPHIPWQSFHIDKSGGTRVRMESGWKGPGWFCRLCSNCLVIARIHRLCSWAVLFKTVFWYGPFLNSLLNLLQYRLFSVAFFWLWGMWHLSSLTHIWDPTCIPCMGRS